MRETMIKDGSIFRCNPTIYLRVIACSVLALIFIPVAALAQSPGTLFVLMKSDNAFDRSSVEDLIGVPIHWLETDLVVELTGEIQSGLPDLEGMSKQEVLEKMPEIEARLRTLITPNVQKLNRAYSDAAVAGEISVRFGVKHLPAIVEVSDGGYFRLVEGVSDPIESIRQLDTLPYQHESDRLQSAASVGGADSVGRVAAEQSVTGLPRNDPNSTAASREAECNAFDPSSLIDLGDGILRLAEPGGGYCGTGAPSKTKYSVLDAFIDASSTKSFDCMDLTVSGVCLYFTTRVFCSLAGCSIKSKPEASIELTHFNPDALVGISKRLGASPLAESELLYGTLQNSISKFVMELLFNRQVPPGYTDPDQWGGVGTESQTTGAKSTMKYHEVDIIGHPGSVYQFVDESGVSFTGITDRFTEIPENVVDGATDGVDQVAGSATTNNLNDVFVHADDISDLPGWEEHPPESLIFIAEKIFPAGVAGSISAMVGAYDSVSGLLDDWETVSGVDDLATAFIEDIVPEDLLGDLEDAVAIFEEVNAIQDTIGEIPGLGGDDIDLFKFCPYDSDILKPYFLSGINIPQWRFNIPEIVYPQTYAFPLPNSELFIGLADGISDTEVTNAEGDRFPISETVSTFTSLFGSWGCLGVGALSILVRVTQQIMMK